MNLLDIIFGLGDSQIVSVYGPKRATGNVDRAAECGSHWPVGSVCQSAHASGLNQSNGQMDSDGRENGTRSSGCKSGSASGVDRMTSQLARPDGMCGTGPRTLR